MFLLNVYKNDKYLSSNNFAVFNLQSHQTALKPLESVGSPQIFDDNISHK